MVMIMTIFIIFRFEMLVMKTEMMMTVRPMMICFVVVDK